MDCIQPLYKLCGTKTGYRWVIEGDVRACFDKIPHDRLVEEVARRIADTKVLTLIRRFLKSGIMIERTLVPSEEGTPQGGICSPVLANIYLHRFDEWYSQHYAAPDQKADPRGYHAWKKQRAKGSNLAAVQMFRYADDVRHFTQDEILLAEKGGSEETTSGSSHLPGRESRRGKEHVREAGNV